MARHAPPGVFLDVGGGFLAQSCEYFTGIHAHTYSPVPLSFY